MKNAHERFGELVYIRRSEKTRTHIRVHLNAWIGEESKAHLVSVIAGDTEIGALSAAFASHDPLQSLIPMAAKRSFPWVNHQPAFRGAINIYRAQEATEAPSCALAGDDRSRQPGSPAADQR